MKRACTILVTSVALLVTSCGLKVPATIVAGSNETGNLDQTGSGSTTTGPNTATGAVNTGTGTGTGSTGGKNGATGATGSLAGLFKNETEGVTNDRITICSHVPISGAAPIPHDPERFGQFYFNYVNKELGGIYGRRVTFRAINDNYNPAGARNAIQQCYKSGAFLYFGAAGTDQIVSVAKWAEMMKVPYVHGPTSEKDLGGHKYNVYAGPTYEYQHILLARYLVKRFGADKRYITIKVDSPYFDAGANAFRTEMKRLGVTLPPDIRVQKDENQFQSVYYTLQGSGDSSKAIDVINNFTTPNLWIKMLAQKSPTYNPWWSAVSPVAGFNIVAHALSDAQAKAVVFHNFGPACECATYKEEEISQHKDLPWYNDIKEFLRVFKAYSREQEPPPDDFDYASFLAARATHRLLLAVGPQPTRTKLFSLLGTYKETPNAMTYSSPGAPKSVPVFPGCAADFTRNDKRMGAWRVNVFELVYRNTVGVWEQKADCIDENHPSVK